ncbi:P-loop containing nucleoside triphosphate hydrolase protein [Zopfochytrium polystomum]|nr:P-loop containing nucleoside triphosphate hydrolase protein [Zopfochytrium polystomum]
MEGEVLFVSGSEMRSKVIGDSERRLASLFQTARANAPCIVVIDQLESLVPTRTESDLSSNRLVTSFLVELDGIRSFSSSPILVIGVTAHRSSIDPAVLRPGRMDEVIDIPLPDASARLALLEGFLSAAPHCASRDELARIAEAIDGATGATIENGCREAALAALRADISATTIESHFLFGAFGLASLPM